jgi:hypothetical protein
MILHRIKTVSVYVLLVLCALLMFWACVAREKAIRLDELNSLSHLKDLVSDQLVRIDGPGYGYEQVYLAKEAGMLLSGQEPIFDIVVKGEINQAKKMWIQNFAVNDFSLLLLKGNVFKVRRSVKSQTPAITIAMAGEGSATGLRSDVVSIPKPPYTIARLQFSNSALPNFSLLSYGTNFYVRGTYEANLGSPADVGKAGHRIPTNQILKLLFDIEFPDGKTGTLSGRLYLLHYAVKQIQTQAISFDCLYFVSFE